MTQFHLYCTLEPRIFIVYLHPLLSFDITENIASTMMAVTNAVCLPRWLSWLRHSAHQPGRSAGGAGV